MLRFCFLTLDGVDIAATFGLLWRRRFYSLHVAHDAAQVDTSPGVVLTALELEPLFAGGPCDVYDFLGGFLSNKRSWSSGSQFTTALFGDRPRPRGLAFHLVYFQLKPLVRRLLSNAGAMERVTRALHKFRRSRTPPPVE
jgi:CelD/BcsL family acetyltransferase involved in cellulose biosynthesis